MNNNENCCSSNDPTGTNCSMGGDNSMTGYQTVFHYPNRYDDLSWESGLIYNNTVFIIPQNLNNTCT